MKKKKKKKKKLKKEKRKKKLGKGTCFGLLGGGGAHVESVWKGCQKNS